MTLLNWVENSVRDMPAQAASIARVQLTCGCSCMATSALAMRGSLKLENKPISALG